ncbi:serine hydrolase domain-containing protein [Planomicrobium sp. CPCC 101079]|uniref:serine hydrolase domain-containing protein n=1 Tax=Planomicrobium sp. CPCC 101079 TaxID=2599618 RepID=UPI0011B7950E|nr:serine hydrolase domain-containing protein [Planomicrobium sp. CPCC 101079]TWT13311.1 serine hydrolase [Planomicrobium sp. CPCC 101079]
MKTSTKKKALSTAVACSLLASSLFASPALAGNAKQWDQPGSMAPVLHPGTAKAAGMVQNPLVQVDAAIEKAIAAKTMPGAVAFAARSGHIVKHKAYGHASLYADDGFTEVENPIQMDEDTIFDLASISKIFTTTAAMKLYEEGHFELDDPVALHLPEFAENGKEHVTIRQLMTHTSGFTAWVPLYSQGQNREDRIQYALRYPLANQPGENYTYSDLNLITLGALIEKFSGKRLDEFMKEEITQPLGMADTMYNPPASLKNRIAATEYQPALGRGMVWGEVHDENAWSLDGVAGHAGVFSTATDLAKFAHMLLNDGRYGSKQILKPETVRLLEENQIPEFPGDDHGLGWELNQGWYMDALADPSAVGHTGYTGTSIVINRKNQTIAILLTNRVHPSRNTVSTNGIRREFARAVADAIPAPIPKKEEAWFAGYGDNLDKELRAAIPDGTTEFSFDTWYRTESGSDFGYVETSADGVTWQQVKAPLTGDSSDWGTQTIKLPEGTEHLRFRYQTDASVNGRGWYIGNLKADDREIYPEPQDNSWVLRNY